MKTLFYLGTCSTCRRVMNELDLPDDVTLREIKSEPITEEELDAVKERAGSYEALFNRRSRKYRGLGLADQTLTEDDYRHYILQEYTLLKRPLLVVVDEVFAGSAKKTVAAARDALHG